MICKILLVFCAVSAFASSGFGQDLSDVRISLINGSSIKGSIDAISPDSLVTGDSLPEGLKWEQVVSVDTGRSATRTASPVQLLLVGGGAIKATSIRIEKEVLAIESGSGIETLKLENLMCVVWKTSPRCEELLVDRPTDKDTVLVRTESGLQEVQGILEGLTTTHVNINFRGESRKIAIAKIEAIVIADLGLKPADGVSTELTLIDGSNLVGKLLELSNSKIALELAGGSRVDVLAGKISRIAVQSGALVYLSDISPVEVEERAMFVVQRGWQRDRSILGNTLTLNFRDSNSPATFAKGIGTQSYSRLVFRNDRNFNRFRATVGIDAETNGRGDCQMTVRGDGIRLWSQRVKSGNDPLPISVDISGMKLVELVVEVGEEFDLADHADWCDARFLKSQ